MQTADILIFGKQGQLAWELFATLSPLGRVHALGSQECNLANPEQIRKAIRDINPKLVVNAAAYTAVDKAESDKETANLINAVAPGVIAQECALRNIALVHYSTDYVFNGSSAQPYRETDSPDPQNFYGKSKREGERAILNADAPAFIFRTSWVYGIRGANFLKTMRRLAREREEIRVVSDQVGSPTWSRGIAEVTSLILSQGIRNLSDFARSFGGVYHLTSAGQTTWFEFAKLIFELDVHKEEHKLKNLIPISTFEYPTPAKRPAFSVMSNDHLAATFGISLPHWAEQLQTVMREFQ